MTKGYEKHRIYGETLQNSPKRWDCLRFSIVQNIEFRAVRNAVEIVSSFSVGFIGLIRLLINDVLFLDNELQQLLEQETNNTTKVKSSQ